MATTYSGTVNITDQRWLGFDVDGQPDDQCDRRHRDRRPDLQCSLRRRLGSAQQVTISGSGFYSAFASTSSCGQGWLQVSPNSGQLSTFATTLTVSVIPGSLSAGTCTGTISLSASGGLFSNGTSSQTINVTMVIGGSTVSGPVASPASLVFNLPAGSTQQQSQTFIVNGNGTAYNAQAFGTNLNVSPTSGTTPAVVTVTAGSGSSSGTIVVTSSLGTQNVGVTVNALTSATC